jgi:putative cell wall-binding protein
MRIQLILMLAFLISCGKDVSINNSRLESISSVTDSEGKSVYQEGQLIRDIDDQIKTAGRTYKVSKYSSHQALSFISAQPRNREIHVQIRGKSTTNEIRLEEIKKLP